MIVLIAQKISLACAWVITVANLLLPGISLIYIGVVVVNTLILIRKGDFWFRRKSTEEE